MVGRRTARAEVHSREWVDLVVMRILAIVGSEQRENRCRQKGKGSFDNVGQSRVSWS